MPVSKAQQKAVTKYVKAKYDRFGLTMAKGRLDEIKAHAEAHSESVNGFINRAISEAMERDGAAPVASEGA
ncbi:MAG: Arc family DNA-binding protein [Oscillospiraceae bacterium]|nr:Arc family DNA-binding protein [Oscillospiraceae bacterium]MDE7170319.1 Arc family DNA-binding protein [Oscillospiraceae bacterium]